MAWEISHTKEAWENVEQNLYTLGAEWVAAALVEVKVAKLRKEAPFLSEATLNLIYADVAFHYDTIEEDLLVQKAMQKIEDLNTCSNGGYEFYIDEDGYYTVPVSLIKEHVHSNLELTRDRE